MTLYITNGKIEKLTTTVPPNAKSTFCNCGFGVTPLVILMHVFLKKNGDLLSDLTKNDYFFKIFLLEIIGF